MKQRYKIVVLGAGSASFGLATLVSIMGTREMKGCHVALVDKNPAVLLNMELLAQRINREWDAQMLLTAHTERLDAFEDADFVVSAIEVGPREELWRSDYEIPLKYGVRQPYAENGGPGGFAHAARNIGPVMAIVQDMERICPEALFINYTNPMVRICDAISRYSKIRVIGMCHQIKAGYGMVGYALADYLGIVVPEGPLSTHADPSMWPKLALLIDQVMDKIDIKAAGLNHFTWMLDLREKGTGKDLYPLFAEKWLTLDPTFEPLTRRVYAVTGIFPIPGDEHLCEYLPWVSDSQTKPWEKYDISLYDWEGAQLRRADRQHKIALMADGQESIDELKEWGSEGVDDIIAAMVTGQNSYHVAVNIPNKGNISNLPEGSIVEVPVVITSAGVKGLALGPLPCAAAELCRRELEVVKLCVDAAVHGDRQAALQCLLLDPVITDLDIARKILDDYLESYRQYLPQFFN